MDGQTTITRRSLVLGAAGAGAATVLGGVAPTAASGHGDPGHSRKRPLWRLAERKGIVFGTAFSTRLLPDAEYTRLVNREAALLFTEDDLLWYKLKPTPESELDFSYGDQFYRHAERHGQLVFGAHLVWDEGFGEGWTDDDLWGLSRQQARRLLYPIIRREVRRYRGRTAAWIVANEVIDPEGDEDGFRTEVPWYNTIGREYVAESFHIAHEADPHAHLVLNEFGFETVNEFGDQPTDRQRAALSVIDTLLNEGVPVHGFGTQAHLLADQFADRFDPRQYRRFLGEVADRGLKIHITEMDVLDDGLPADFRIRDRAIADVYARYLEVALDERAVKSLITFGLSDRYTWLEEDYPREDGSPRRPLPYDADLRPKPAYWAVVKSLLHTVGRRQLWEIPRD
jgi:endo-1,4-beta-xylanase